VQRELAFVGWAVNDHPLGSNAYNNATFDETDSWVLHGEMAVSLIKEAQWAIDCAAASRRYLLRGKACFMRHCCGQLSWRIGPVEWHS
jgi:hypothetical protein